MLQADDGPPTGFDHADALARAIAGEGVRVEYQPIVDVQRNVVRGYEALARFAHEPLAPPDVWFGRAGAAGVAAQLDATVSRIALGQRDRLPPDCFLTINVEPSSMLSPVWQAAIDEVRDLTRVVFEITEHRPADPDALAARMRELRERGAMFALDDTGSGYASLGQLLQLRPEFLKLDRSIVVDIDRDEAKVALIEMLGTFGSRLDAWLIAEGVERPAEAAVLQRLGVPLAQGFLYARPRHGFGSVDATALGQGTRVLRTYALADVMDPAETTTVDLAARHIYPSGAGRFVVVVDEHRRPKGIVDLVSDPSRVVECQLVSNVHGEPCELAARLATRSDVDYNVPIVVLDDVGEFAGIVTVGRLLASLGAC